MNSFSFLHELSSSSSNSFAILTGYIATLLSITAFMPLVYDVYKNNNTKGLVLNTLLIYFTAQIIWFLHGYALNDTPVLFSTTINMILYSYLLYRYYTK